MNKIQISGGVVYQFSWDCINSNSYALVEGKNALIVDVIDTDEFWNFLEEREIEEADVILTHEHFDHINGLNLLRSKCGTVVYAHSVCSENIQSEQKNLSSNAGALVELSGRIVNKSIDPFSCGAADVTFDETYHLTWNNHQIEQIHTPGHTKGSLCALLDGQYLFTGDTLMQDPIITILPGGSRKDYENVTKPKLNSLMKTVEIVFPGHGTPW